MHHAISMNPSSFNAFCDHALYRRPVLDGTEKTAGRGWCGVTQVYGLNLLVLMIGLSRCGLKFTAGGLVEAVALEVLDATEKGAGGRGPRIRTNRTCGQCQTQSNDIYTQIYSHPCGIHKDVHR